MKNYNKNIILLEDEIQVQYYMKSTIMNGSENLIIALSPLATYELDKWKISYNTIEDYYEDIDLHTFGIDNYKKVELLCNIIDTHLLKKYTKMSENGIKPAFFNFYNMKNIFDPVFTRLYQLIKLIEREKPKEIYIFKNQNHKFNSNSMVPEYLFRDEESIYYKLLELPIGNCNIKRIGIESYHNFNIIQYRQKIIWKCKEKLIHGIKKIPNIYDICLRFKYFGWKGLFNKYKEPVKALNNSPILIYGNGGNWDFCIEKMKNAGMYPVIRIQNDYKQWIDDEIIDKKDPSISVWNDLINDPLFHDTLTWKDIDVFPVLEDKLKYFIMNIAPSCIKVYEKAKKVLRRKSIKALLTSNLSSCFDHTYAKAAHDENVPIISWQHGGSGAFKHPILSYMDLMSSDVFLSFGEGTIRHQLADANKSKLKLVPIGSTALDDLYKSSNRHFRKKDNMTVTYFPTHLNLNRSYISGMPPFSDNSIWKTIKSTTDLLGQHPEHEIVIKLHPTFVKIPPIKEYLKRNNFKNIQLYITNISLKQLFSISDVIIIDLATTILLQSLTTNLPIFIYTGNLYLDQKAFEMLQKRAYCFENLDEFLNNINQFLSGKRINEKDYYNTEFLENFGIHKLDGKSDDRAVMVLSKTVYNGIDRTNNQRDYNGTR